MELNGPEITNICYLFDLIQLNLRIRQGKKGTSKTSHQILISDIN